MDLNMFPPDLITGIVQDLVSQALVEVGGKVRRAIAGTPREQAIRQAYHQAITAFIASLPESANTYVDVIEQFFTDNFVVSEFSTLLTPAANIDIDVDGLSRRFEELGFDLTTMPEFSFERAMQSFTAAFTQAAAEDSELRSILSYHNLQRIDAKMTTLLALHEGTDTIVRELLQERLIGEQTDSENSQAPESTPPRQYLYPSQQVVRYVSLAADEKIPDAIVRMLQGLAMTSENWVTESSDTVEFILNVEDFMLIVESLKRIGQNNKSGQPLPPAKLIRAIATEATHEFQTSLKLMRQHKTRPIPHQARQMREIGMPYVVLGVASQFAGLIEVIRNSLHPVPAATPNRVKNEIHFESFEEILDVFTTFQRVVEKAGGDEERFLASFIEEGMNRAIGKLLQRSGLEEPAITTTQATSAITDSQKVGATMPRKESKKQPRRPQHERSKRALKRKRR